ncbi:MAG: (Fe-S)-binding protein [Asgard group archaeon]|nr:(Fe-S)-binding protein [Asgard group archaeon]
MGILKSIKKRFWMIKAIIKASPSERRNILKGFKERKKYRPKKDSNANIKNLSYCMLCPNMCRFDCPVVQATKKETHSPAIKSRIAYYIEMDYLSANCDNIQPLFEGCLHCAGCKVWCPFDFAVGELLEGVAIDLFQENATLHEVKDFSVRIQNYNGLYPKEKLLKNQSSILKMTEGTIYYFPGCVTIGNNQKVINSLAKIAEKADIKLKSDINERWCCGAPTIYSGDIEEAKKLAAHNKEHFEKSNINTIICECPECANMLKNEYPKLGFDLKIPIYHVNEWIRMLIDDGIIDLKNLEKLKEFSNLKPISYHDPCVLTRKLNVIDDTYYILNLLFPESFKEVLYSREKTHCCGYGGLVNIVNPKVAQQVAKNRLTEFKNQDIKTIVTSCPTCNYSLSKNDFELNFEIIDLLELISKAATKIKKEQ